MDDINDETNEVAREILYTDENRAECPDTTPRAWVHVIPEYTAVPGTPNIQGVAALVLGGFLKVRKQFVRFIIGLLL